MQQTRSSVMHQTLGLRPQLVIAKHAGMLPGNVTSTKISLDAYLRSFLARMRACVGGLVEEQKVLF